jgi:alkylation response protein AidB-like acyl-CoA dehydrogenase
MSVPRKSVELGLTAMTIPEEYGAWAGTVLTAAGTRRTPAWAHCRSSALAMNSKQKYLPKLAKLGMLAAYALTEPWAASDALAARTRADPASAVTISDGRSTATTLGIAHEQYGTKLDHSRRSS